MTQTKLRLIVKAEGTICINRYIDKDKIQLYINKSKEYGHKYAVCNGNNEYIEGNKRTMQQGLNMSKL